jgi:enhancing lycopene biosynthesis protein 2
MKRVAVILAGCGRMDGSEVHESTLSLLYLAQGGAAYQCFAPDEPQLRVVDHITRKQTSETRNQMVEAGRIARGEVLPLSQARPEEFDALVLPGGAGAFHNLSHGPGHVHPDVRRMVLALADAHKPIAAICIAPVLIARILGDRHVCLTIGNDPETIAEIENLGARHELCNVRGCVSDEAHRIVTTPAYMLGPGIADVAAGIQACIETLLKW